MCELFLFDSALSISVFVHCSQDSERLSPIQGVSTWSCLEDALLSQESQSVGEQSLFQHTHTTQTSPLQSSLWWTPMQCNEMTPCSFSVFKGVKDYSSKNKCSEAAQLHLSSCIFHLLGDSAKAYLNYSTPLHADTAQVAEKVLFSLLP